MSNKEIRQNEEQKVASIYFIYEKENTLKYDFFN
jgi:hypothetical protein